MPIFVKLQKVIFEKLLLTENLQERLPLDTEHSIAIHSISMEGYVTSKKYWLLSVPSSVARRRAVSVIFEK